MSEAAAAPAWTLRRACVDDAPAFVRVMQVPAVARQLMQLPYPDEASWRQRLAAQVSANGQSPELHLVAEERRPAAPPVLRATLPGLQQER